MKTTTLASDLAIEHRQEYRLNTELTVFIELKAATTQQPAIIVICNSLDISANGLRVIADQHIESGSILRCCVKNHDHTQQFILITEIKWSQPWENPNEFLLGLSLFESEDTDIQAWKEFIAQECSD